MSDDEHDNGEEGDFADWNEEEDGVWQPDKKEAGELCVGKDEEGQPQAKMLQASPGPAAPAISL